MSDSKRKGTVSRPGRLLKLIFDAPGWLYRAHLGWILGKRILVLTHRGRKSGRPYDTVLEVMHFDRATGESVMASAYGPRADWYQNIRAEPALRVRTGGLDYVPAQRFLTPDEAREAANRFCRDHPWEAKLVPRVLPAIGADVPADSHLGPADLLASLPMVAFRPR